MSAAISDRNEFYIYELAQDYIINVFYLDHSFLYSFSLKNCEILYEDPTIMKIPFEDKLHLRACDNPFAACVYGIKFIRLISNSQGNFLQINIYVPVFYIMNGQHQDIIKDVFVKL